MTNKKLKKPGQGLKAFRKTMLNFRSLAKNSFLLEAVLFLIVLGLFIPLRYIQAIGIDWLVGIGKDTMTTFFNVTLGLALQIIVSIGNVFLAIAAGLLGWVTNGFTSLSYTSPAGNPILQIGWTLVRDLANIGIVLALVIISLGTALRLGEYDAKKTLPVLILVALLINFTPVICGLVVDAGNILMNFFIKDLGGWNGLLSSLSQQGNALKTLIEDPTSPAFLGQSIGLAAFTFLGAAILFLYTALFIMRYIAIWILVILSPIAFFSYILPATRSYFTQWWNQFIQWSFIGAVAGFFLYLSHYILYLVGQNNASALKIAPNAGKNIAGGGFIDTLLPYTVVLAFLYIGFFVAMSTNAMGASGVISVAQEGFRKGSKWVGKRSLKAIRETPRVTRAEERIRRRLETMPVIGGALGGPGAYTAELTKRKGEYKKKLEAMSDADIRSTITRLPSYRSAGLETLAERGSLTDADKQFISHAKLYKADMSKILKARPDWAPEIKPERVTELMQQWGINKSEADARAIRELIEKTKPADFRKNVQTEALRKPEVFTALTHDQVKDMGNKGTVDQKRALFDVITKQKGEVKARTQELRNEYYKLRHTRKTYEAGLIKKQVHEIGTKYHEVENNPNFRRV